MGLVLWVEFFEDLQHVRGRSLNTVMSYRHDLELYSEFVETLQPIFSIYQFMKNKGLSERSQARVISSLRTYFRFLEEHGHPANELRELRPPKIKQKLPRAIDLAQFEKLLEASRVDDPHKSARNHMTLVMLFGLGCRVSELIGIDLLDLNLTEGRVTITGKGGKQRLVPLTDFLLNELKTYLSLVRDNLAKPNVSSVLINDRGKRPSRIDIWRWLAAWSITAGFSEPVGPHQFRHGCATALLESGADLRSIQMILGHASLQTTQIYTSVSRKKMAESLEEAHPFSQLEGLGTSPSDVS